MSERTNRFVYTGEKTNGTTRHTIYLLRSFDEGSSYGNPDLSFVSGSNEFYDMTESTPPASSISYFYKVVPKGWYRLAVYDSDAGTYDAIEPFDKFYHATLDIDNHINDDDADMRHDHDAINIASADAARLGNSLDAAIDNFIGAAWTDGVDDSLKTHLDHSTTTAHPATAISCSVGAETDVEGALDDHETRITALETGTASTPTGIHDYTGDLGIDVVWTAQDVEGIEYAVMYLWKHTSESVPATYADLDHYRRCLAPETEITFRSRLFDLTSSTDSNLILYYAIGAKGRADASFTWSAVQSIEVTLPVFNQVFSGNLSGLSVCCSSGSASVYALDSVDIGSDENFPEATESGDAPLTNFITQAFQSQSVTITGIEFYSDTALSGDIIMNYRSTTSGTSGTFTVSQSTKKGYVTGLSVPVSAGDDLQIWTTKPRGASHWRIKIWFTRG